MIEHNETDYRMLKEAYEQTLTDNRKLIKSRQSLQLALDTLTERLLELRDKNRKWNTAMDKVIENTQPTNRNTHE